MLNASHTVPVLDGFSPENIPAEILSSAMPLVLKDFCANWQIVEEGKNSARKAANYLMGFDQGKKLKASYLPPEAQGRVFYNSDMSGFNFTNKELTLAHILVDIFSQKNLPEPAGIYVASTSLHHFFPGLAEQTAVTNLTNDLLVNIWLGNQSRIAAHYDFAQNLACSVVGHRRFTLFPPEQGKNLYVGPLDKAPGGQEISTVDFRNPDFDRYPKFKQALAVAQVAELAPGDALVLPSMWWHHVEGLDEFNVLITRWWRDSAAFMGRPTNALLLAMLSLRDLPKAQRDAWQAIFKHYVFDYQAENFEHIPDNAKGYLASPMSELTARKLRAELQNKLRR